ncbi:mobile mystery protein B [Mesorhizobium sp. B2-7-2]|uniref:mobile mystery protein B n=1 Tax=Mesorhizobium sp. B2-7-2 TaxID=2589908 RepID=UPI001FED5AB6|nr:mobile mystery protein B [Mesorhizobium sp. B2-7-2]
MTIKLEYPEGATPLDPNEIGGLRHKHVTTQGQLDELEQANIITGFRWLARTRRNDILTDDFAVELHRRLFGDVWDWAGSFRKTGKNIGVDPVQIGVQLRGLMDDAQYWADHKTYPPIEAAVRLHHRMVFIHPIQMATAATRALWRMSFSTKSTEPPLSTGLQAQIFKK